MPFKSHSKIVRQIAWAEKEKFREGIYDLAHHNCEHFANMIVYGINYSEQIESNKAKLMGSANFIRGFLVAPTLGLNLIGEPYTINNNKGSTIKLINEMRESNGKLGYTDAYH